MCGIAGIVGLKDRESAQRKIRLMADSLRHRGPDATGVFVGDHIAFGHLRLSIIDLSDAANQPFFDVNNRYCLIFNGEIYNYREVKRLLPDYPFRTNSDTEVILAAFAEFGPECLSLLNGMFALAIWDNVDRSLFIARDRLGVKPLYYHLTDDGAFLFGSEIRALLNSQLIPRKINNDAVYDYLLYQSVYAPQTIVEDIFQLPAGTYGIFRDGRLNINTYWNIAQNDGNPLDDDEISIKRNVRELLLKSVERRLVSDVRLGAFLSGGIDSSAVVGLMSEISSQPIDTFSVTFREKEFDESVYSNLIARKFNTRHTTVDLKAEDFLAELPNALKATDAPSGDGVNTYVVSKATKRSGITVALSGLGGDELFAGYPNFINWYKTGQGLLPRIPGIIRRPFAAAIAHSNNTKYQRLGDILGAQNLSLSEVYPMFRQVISQQNAASLYRHGDRQLSIKKLIEAQSAEIEKFPLLSQFTIAELIGYTQNVLLKDTDQFSMASALEIREPFFDYQLVEYVLRIPDKIKYPKYPKSLLVESIYPLLPDKIVHRPKMGFVLPFEKWMRNELREFCNRRITRLADRKIFTPSTLLGKWHDFLEGKNRVLWSHLWHLVVLDEWLENNNF